RFNGLEYGKYYFMETKSPYGYYLNRGKVDFEITENEKLLTFTLENTRIPDEPSDPEGRIRIIKKDTDTNELLSGAEFDIISSTGRRVDTLRTNSRGEATSRWLSVGYYTIEEVRAPNGYRLDPRLSEERVRNGETVEIVIYNEKVDPDDPEPTDPTDPEDPDDPEPTDPTDPTDPDNPDPTDPTKPVDPEDPDPNDPTDPTKPVDPEDPGEDDEFEDGGGKNPSDKPEGEDEFEDGGGDKPGGKPGLPKTGSATPIFFYGLGGLSILVGAMLRRKKED
ncbi:MAG: LPXTG cell wall anchor domain-containing protein, partial [Tissierellia bacterium]|nr:LPXTG cell wall anchor domain-containing protein [Tissierellia bacterium]